MLGDTGRLFDLLLRQDPVPDAASDWVSVRPFIVGDDYGTRCATVIVVDHNDQVTFIEKRFGPGGRPQSESSFNFALVAAEEC